MKKKKKKRYSYNAKIAMSAGRRAIYTCIPLNKINEVNKKVLSKTKIPLRVIMEAKFGIRYLV